MAADGGTASEEVKDASPAAPAPNRWRPRLGEAEAAEPAIAPQEVRGVLWRVLLAAAAVSGGINLLQLAPAIYMYQVYDRVLSTQHIETLVAITVVVLLALVLLAALDGARNAVGMRLGMWLERSLAGPLLHAT